MSNYATYFKKVKDQDWEVCPELSHKEVLEGGGGTGTPRTEISCRRGDGGAGKARGEHGEDGQLWPRGGREEASLGLEGFFRDLQRKSW